MFYHTALIFSEPKSVQKDMHIVLDELASNGSAITCNFNKHYLDICNWRIYFKSLLSTPVQIAGSKPDLYLEPIGRQDLIDQLNVSGAHKETYLCKFVNCINATIAFDILEKTENDMAFFKKAFNMQHPKILCGHFGVPIIIDELEEEKESDD